MSNSNVIVWEQLAVVKCYLIQLPFTTTEFIAAHFYFIPAISFPFKMNYIKSGSVAKSHFPLLTI